MSWLWLLVLQLNFLDDRYLVLCRQILFICSHPWKFKLFRFTMFCLLLLPCRLIFSQKHLTEPIAPSISILPLRRIDFAVFLIFLLRLCSRDHSISHLFSTPASKTLKCLYLWCGLELWDDFAQLASRTSIFCASIANSTAWCIIFLCLMQARCTLHGFP